MSSLTFRNSLGERVDIPSIASTDVKNAFGTMLDRVAGGGPVAITRHDAPRAVLLAFAEFQSRMQALDATPAVLGRAAVKATGAKPATPRPARRVR